MRNAAKLHNWSEAFLQNTMKRREREDAERHNLGKYIEGYGPNPAEQAAKKAELWPKLSASKFFTK